MHSSNNLCTRPKAITFPLRRWHFVLHIFDKFDTTGSFNYNKQISTIICAMDTFMIFPWLMNLSKECFSFICYCWTSFLMPSCFRLFPILSHVINLIPQAILIMCNNITKFYEISIINWHAIRRVDSFDSN